MARLILHIGTHKTATTSIQKFLALHRSTLAERGVFYPGYDLIGHKSHYAHLGIVNALSGRHTQFSAEDAQTFFRKVRERVQDFDTTVISAEPFYRHVKGGGALDRPEVYWPARMAYLEQLRDIFGEAEIVVVFRRQADYAQSLYQEHVKVTSYHKPFRDFLTDFWYHFAFLDQARAWNQVFPGLKALSFEKLAASGDAVAEFTRLIGLPCQDLPPAARHNDGMAVDMVILKRLLHMSERERGSKEDMRPALEELEARLGPELFSEIEPRSFFRNAEVRDQFQQGFARDNEALKSFIIQSYGPEEPTFPDTFKARTRFGDGAPSPHLMQAIVALCLGQTLSHTDTGVAGPAVLPARKAAAGNPLPVTVFGDSHARVFFPSKEIPLVRCGFNGRKLRLLGLALPSASAAGLMPGAATPPVREIIQTALPDTQHLCLAFGQADLELWYYYHKVIRQDAALTPKSYVAWLLEQYEGFVTGLAFDRESMVLKGVNLTALRETALTLRYVSVILAKDMADPGAVQKMLEPQILTEAAQNAMGQAFNAGLRRICKRHGMGYFDINAELAAPLTDGKESAVLADCHRSATFEPHLADTVQVRRSHLNGLLRAFGANPARYAAS